MYIKCNNKMDISLSKKNSRDSSTDKRTSYKRASGKKIDLPC